ISGKTCKKSCSLAVRRIETFDNHRWFGSFGTRRTIKTKLRRFVFFYLKYYLNLFLKKKNKKDNYYDKEWESFRKRYEEGNWSDEDDDDDEEGWIDVSDDGNDFLHISSSEEE